LEMVNEIVILKEAKCMGIVKGPWGERRKEKKRKETKSTITVEINSI